MAFEDSPGVLVGGCSSFREYLADGVHDRVAVHGVGAGAAVAGAGDGAAAVSGDPVHLPAGPGLEHGPVGLGEQPDMVVGAPDPCRVLGEDLASQHAGKFAPVASRAFGSEGLPVLGAGRVIPGT